MAKPFEEALEAYFKAEHGVEEVWSVYAMETSRDYGEGGAVDREGFVITVWGTVADTGERFYQEYENSAAAELLQKMFDWED